MKKEQSTRLLLPKGEWMNALLRAFAVAGLTYEPSSPRSLELANTSKKGPPIVFSLVRSWEVWPTLQLVPEAVGGFTGTDIAREQLARSLWMASLLDSIPGAPAPSLFFGATPRLCEQIEDERQPKISDVVGTRLYTSYPNTAALYLMKRGIEMDKVEIVQSAGSVEGFWRIDPKNGAIFDIKDSGETLKQNKIIVLETLPFEEGVVFVSEDMSSIDQQRVDDLREMMTIASQKRRGI